MALPIGSPEQFGSILRLPEVSPTPQVGRAGGKPGVAGGIAGSGRPEGVPDTASFGEQLSEFVKEVDRAERNAEDRATAFAEGRNDDIHGTMLAMEQADIKLKLLSTARNKAIQAYQQVMRMGQ